MLAAVVASEGRERRAGAGGVKTSAMEGSRFVVERFAGNAPRDDAAG